MGEWVINGEIFKKNVKNCKLFVSHSERSKLDTHSGINWIILVFSHYEYKSSQ